MGFWDEIRDFGIGAVGAAGSLVAELAAGSLTKAREDKGHLDDDADTTPAGANEDTAASNPVPQQKAPEDPKSMFWDPFAIIEQLGYKDRPTQLTYGTLKAIVWRTPIIRAIIQTRVQQVAAFAQPQHDRYQLGFRIKLREQTKEPSKADREWMQRMESVIQRTGVTDNPRGRDDFETFLRKYVLDSLIYDQGCFEVVPDRKGRPCEFYAIDAASIRLADSASLFIDEDQKKRTRYVQIYDSVVVNEYNQEELCFGVRNPSTDLRLYGYGVSELEMLISCITSILYAWEYNQRFFCVKGNTLVTTRNGQELIEDLEGTEFEIWNGCAWQKAHAFATQRQKIARTVLWNGLVLESGPEHRIRVIPRDSLDGLPEWRQQRELVPGDFVLTDTKANDPPLNLKILRVGEVYATDRSTGRDFSPSEAMVQDLEFWEMIGFALGDGYWPNLDKRSASWLRIFPHYRKDAELFSKFLRVCERHGIHAQQIQINKGIERDDGELGYPCIQIGHRAFVEWLYDLGFQCSTDGKRIGKVLWQQPARIRAALLRGLFSADGCTTMHVTGYTTPTIYCANPILRQDILRCLLSLGISANNVGTGINRSGTIAVQDVEAFNNAVGYLLPYKAEGSERAESSRNRWDGLHPVCSQRIAGQLKAVNREVFTVADWELIRKAARGACRLSRPRAIALLRTADMEIPDELNYHQVAIDFVEESNESELMFDVEVFSEDHAFLANGILVHNSQGSAAKGIINFKGTIPEKQLQAFRRHWYQMLSSVQNAWRTPITNTDELQYINLQQSSRDMEFNAWMDFLIKIACGMYTIDPLEINFKYGNTGQRAGMQESRNKEKITESKERGLRPLLRFIERCLNRYVIWPINESFEFEFIGLDALTREELAELNMKRVKSFLTIDELRAEDDLEPLPDGQGEVVLDPVYLQFYQMKQGQAQGGVPGAPGAPGSPMGEGGGEQPPKEEGGTDFDALLRQYEQQQKQTGKDEAQKNKQAMREDERANEREDREAEKQAKKSMTWEIQI